MLNKLFCLATPPTFGGFNNPYLNQISPNCANLNGSRAKEHHLFFHTENYAIRVSRLQFQAAEYSGLWAAKNWEFL